MDKTFLHVDMDAFFASVEQRDNPVLRGRPVIVGAPPDQRGVVSAASYEARTFGVHSAMPSREAARLCPHAVFLPVNGARYHEVSQQVFRILESFTPLVEPVSIDEAFMDVTGVRQLFGSGPEVAAQVKKRIRRDLLLSASVGVAPNKFLAKIASDLNKPDGLTVVPRTQEGIRGFLAPLPVGRIWGVGKVMRRNLEEAGVSTIGHLQAVPVEQLARIVGRHAAAHLQRLAWGQDAREIELERDEKSISKEHTFPEDCRDPEVLRATLGGLVEDVGRRLRAGGRFAGLARLKLRWQDFKTITRQRPLAPACCDDISLREAAEELFLAERLVKPVRLIGFGVAQLTTHAPEQLSLFPEEGASRKKRESLSRAVDAIRDKLGEESIGSGRARPGSAGPDS
jgi:DNA polymerase-4